MTRRNASRTPEAVQKEVQITLFAAGAEDKYMQLAPLAIADRRPCCVPLTLTGKSLKDLQDTYTDWAADAASDTKRKVLLAKLKELGSLVLTGDLEKLLPLSENPERIRAMVYTDAQASSIPVEAAYSGDVSAKGISRGFLAGREKLRIDFVRHLSLGPLMPYRIRWGAPLRLLVVLSNPAAPDAKLGEVSEQGGRLAFSETSPGWLHAESKTLEACLGGLCRLGLLHISFLVGDEGSRTVYAGELVPGSAVDDLAWQVLSGSITELKQRIVDELKTAERENTPYHVLHYYGHGAEVDSIGELFTRPGPNMSSSDLADLKQMPRIVVLNACHAAVPDYAQPGQVLTGFASALLYGGTAVLISMMTAVCPQTATATTKLVYHHLARSLFVDPLSVENALHELRHGFLVADHEQPDFFVPILYMRPVQGQGQLFSYQDPRIQIWNAYNQGRICLNPVALAETTWLMRKRLLPSRAKKPKKPLLQRSPGSTGLPPG